MIERLEGYIKDTHEPPRHEHHIDEQSIEEQREQREQTVAIAESETREESEATTEPNMSSSSAEYARINAQFNNIATNVPILPIPAQPQHPQQFPQHPHTPRAAALNTPRPVPQAQPAQPHFNIIDMIDENRFLVKISFNELLEYAAPIMFNRHIDEEQADKILSSIEEGYMYPFTMDAIYDSTVNIGEKNIKIINGNHRHYAIYKYVEKLIAKDEDPFNCKYYVYVWISVVDECESTNKKLSMNLYTLVNNHLPFKEPINVNIDAMDFVNKLFKHKSWGGNAIIDTCKRVSQPRIKKAELYEFLDKHKDILEDFVSMHSVDKNNLIITEDILDKFIKNIDKINTSIWKKYIDNPTDVYSSEKKLVKNSNIWGKAKKENFYLNLIDSNFPKEIWIKHLSDPSSI
jgi:hypothetical protein